MRSLVLDEGLRADGRGVTDIRPITSRASVLPCTHGSSLFTRGETQVGGVQGPGRGIRGTVHGDTNNAHAAKQGCRHLPGYWCRRAQMGGGAMGACWGHGTCAAPFVERHGVVGSQISEG